MAIFSSTGSFAGPSIGYGTFTPPYPVGSSSNGMSIRTKIREAIAYMIKNTVKISNGYFQDIAEVHVNAPVNNSQRKDYPSVDVIWLRERYTNSFQGGNSLGGYNKFATVLISGYLWEDGCQPNAEEMVRLRENFVADMEKLFGTNHSLVGEQGRSAFNSIILSNTVFGLEATDPRGGVDIELDVSYRIELEDPTQDF